MFIKSFQTHKKIEIMGKQLLKGKIQEINKDQRNIPWIAIIVSISYDSSLKQKIKGQ